MKTEESTADHESPIDLKRLQLGELEEFEKVYHKYVRKVYAYAFKTIGNREDAEEITQDVFSTVWQNRQTIRSEGVVWVMVKHKCIDRSRKREIPILSVEELDAVAKVTEKKQVEQPQQFLAQISPGEQQVLSLLLQDRTRREIAQILDLPMGTIDSRLHRLKKRLKGETNGK